MNEAALLIFNHCRYGGSSYASLYRWALVDVFLCLITMSRGEVSEPVESVTCSVATGNVCVTRGARVILLEDVEGGAEGYLSAACGSIVDVLYVGEKEEEGWLYVQQGENMGWLELRSVSETSGRKCPQQVGVLSESMEMQHEARFLYDAQAFHHPSPTVQPERSVASELQLEYAKHEEQAEQRAERERTARTESEMREKQGREGEEMWMEWTQLAELREQTEQIELRLELEETELRLELEEARKSEAMWKLECARIRSLLLEAEYAVEEVTREDVAARMRAWLQTTSPALGTWL